MLDRTVLRSIYPRAADERFAAFADQAPTLMRRFGLDAHAQRLLFFLAQVGHESGGLTRFEENLRYRAERLCSVWPRRFPSLEAARRCIGDPELLANTVYANRMGNGDAASGDGWRFRGRGYLQVTGRDGYRNVGKRAGLDLEHDPDLASSPQHALLTACAVWEWKGLNALCDAGDFVRVTKRINGGTNGMNDRRAWLARVRRALPAAAVAVGSDPSTACARSEPTA